MKIATKPPHELGWSVLTIKKTKMRTETIKIYTFDELPTEKAKEKAREWYRINGGDYAWSDEYLNTLKSFESIMSVKVYHWRCDTCGNPYWSVEIFPSGSAEIFPSDEIKGKYLRRYLNNEIMWRINKSRRFIKYASGYNDEQKRWNKQRHSKVLFTDYQDCPLTGFSADIEILKPIADFMSKPYDDNYSLKDLVDDCLHSFFRDWQSEMEWQETDEYIDETLIANEYEFTEDGKRY